VTGINFLLTPSLSSRGGEGGMQVARIEIRFSDKEVLLLLWSVTETAERLARSKVEGARVNNSYFRCPKGG